MFYITPAIVIPKNMILSFANKLTSRLLNKAHKVLHDITLAYPQVFPLSSPAHCSLHTTPITSKSSSSQLLVASPFTWNAFPNCLLNNYLSEFSPSFASSRNPPEPHSTPPKPLPCRVIIPSLYFCWTLYRLCISAEPYFALLPSFGYFLLIEHEIIVSGDWFLS